MIRLDPDPRSGGYAYMPIRSVTSRFPAGRDARGAVEAWTRAGFRDDRIDAFSGEFGADQLDTQGHSHGVWGRFVRTLEDMFTAEAQLFRRADEAMRSGGVWWPCSPRAGRRSGGGRRTSCSRTAGPTPCTGAGGHGIHVSPPPSCRRCPGAGVAFRRPRHPSRGTGDDP
jgi:hypothetical protein